MWIILLKMWITWSLWIIMNKYMKEPCPMCGGTGESIGRECTLCKGYGFIVTQHKGKKRKRGKHELTGMHSYKK